MSEAMMGNKKGCHPCSEETKKKISEALKGKTFSEERKANLSKAKKGKHYPMSKDTALKIQNSEYHTSIRKKVYCEETNTIYESIQECARQLNIDATYICACCKGKIKSCKGYHFRYYEEI